MYSGPTNYVIETRLGINVSSRKKKPVSNGIENVSSSTKSNSWGIDAHIFKMVDVSKLALTGLVYELPTCRCITGRTTYLPVWSLMTLVYSLQEGDCRIIWFSLNRARYNLNHARYSDIVVPTAAVSLPAL